MSKHGLHPGLERRLQALAERIATLRHTMSKAAGAEKIEEHAEINELERRYKFLEGGLEELNRQGEGFRQNMKAEVEKVADDLSATLEDWIMKLDSQQASRQTRRR